MQQQPDHHGDAVVAERAKDGGDLAEVGLASFANGQAGDGFCDESKDTNGCHEHDHIHQLDDHCLQALEDRQNRLPMLAAHLHQSYADQ